VLRGTQRVKDVNDVVRMETQPWFRAWRTTQSMAWLMRDHRERMAAQWQLEGSGLPDPCYSAKSPLVA